MKILGLISAVLVLWPCFSQAQSLPVPGEEKGIYAVVRDVQGEEMEGFFRLNSDELSVRSQDNQEKNVPLKSVQSITLERNKEEAPGASEVASRPASYKVRLLNSQEIYTLQKKYSFSLNTDIGLITRILDPERIRNFFNKESAPAGKLENGKPLLQDQSVIFSLEFKF